MKGFTKQLRLSGGKAAMGGAEVTPEVLAKINSYALVPLTADDVYVRKFLTCHSAIDRDNERFPEELLDYFAATLPGKSFLFGHDRNNFYPLGLFFDAYTEVMSADAFKALTGEEPRLPEGTATVKVVWGWMYMLKEKRQDEAANIDAGVYRHVSISFRAADIRPVKKDVNGPTLYWEYVGPGEATEASLVWLGAQPGATAQKAAGAEPASHHKGDGDMKKMLLLLGTMLGKSFADDTTEETLANEVKKALGDKDAKIAELTTQVSTLQPLADDGKSYRDSLVADYVRMKAALGEAETDATKQEGIKAFASGMPMAMLQGECKHLQTRMDVKFPGGQLQSGDPNGNRQDGGKCADDNPLIVND